MWNVDQKYGIVEGGNIRGTTPLKGYWDTNFIGLKGSCSMVTEMAGVHFGGVGFYY
jgi:hypothetical protein